VYRMLLQGFAQIFASRVTNLYIAYQQYLLTLSFSQVSCERAFSKLKIIKTRLRASLGNDKLETFMLMSSEKDVLDSITIDDLIHELVKDCQFFAKMLLLQSYKSHVLSTDYCMLIFHIRACNWNIIQCSSAVDPLNVTVAVQYNIDFIT